MAVEMSVEVLAPVLRARTGLNQTEKLVLLGIANHAHPDGRNSWPAVETLARYAEVSPRSVQRALRSLESGGWITTETAMGGTETTPRDRRTNRYSLVMERILECDGASLASPRGMTRVTDRGDTGDTAEVTGVSPEPSVEPSRTVTGSSVPEDHPARSLCDYLADAVEMKRGEGHRPRVTERWVTEMERLLRIGPPEVAGNHPVPEEHVRRMIDYWWRTHPDGPSPGKFAWSDVVESAPKLRERWERMRTDRNRTIQSRQGESRTAQTGASWMDRSAGGVDEIEKAIQEAAG